MVRGWGGRGGEGQDAKEAGVRLNPGGLGAPKTGTAEARRVRVRSTRGGVGGGRARTERTCGIVSPGKDDAAVARRGWDASIVPARARGRGEDECGARGLIALSTTAPPRVTSRVLPARDFAVANGRRSHRSLASWTDPGSRFGSSGETPRQACRPSRRTSDRARARARRTRARVGSSGSARRHVGAPPAMAPRRRRRRARG